MQLSAGAAAPALDVTDAGDGLLKLTITDGAIDNKVKRAVEQTIEVLNRRVNGLGTTEPNIQRQGTDRVLVEVPGLQDTNRLKEIVGTTAKLEFRLVGEPGANPGDVDMLDQTDQPGKLPVEKQVMVQGEDLTDAQPGFDSRNGEPVVNFRFNIRGGQKFGQVTSANVGRPFAIVLDNKVISAPRILGPITGGSGQISGRFTVEQANNLAILLRAGALPAKLTIVEERTVGPGLGQDSIEAGKRAAYVAAALVVSYMLITYGIFGIFANIALLIHISMIFAALVLLRATLTLPGIAGIVLTIGMAVDSNVLIYERIREESHAGRSMISALDAGFNRAFATIVDSNVTMFVVAAILYFLGSGPVRGFAVSLALGILTTIVTAVTMTRMMIALWYRYAARPNCRSNPAGPLDETPSPRARKHQIPLHALPARVLSLFGGALDPFGRAVPLRRHEFRHRLFRRHADGSAGADRAPPIWPIFATCPTTSASAISKCRVSARPPTPRSASACSRAAIRRSRRRSRR